MTRAVVDPVAAAGPILHRLAPLIAAFDDAGRELALVGGIVRDLALGVAGGADDIDATTDARPDEIKRLVGPLADAVWAQGERFGTIGLRLGDDDLEITTHRAEVYDPESRKPVVAFGDDLVTDLARRDFTINAMAVDTRTATLVDPHDGLRDLADGRLRTPLSPSTSFGDDPLRMLRAARFLARFDLEADPALIEAMAAMADRLAIVSGERIRDELDKLLTLERPSTGLVLLADTGLLTRVEPSWGPATPTRVDVASVVTDATADPALRRVVLLGAADDTGRVLTTLRHSGAVRRSTLRALELAAEVAELGADGGIEVADADVRGWRRRLGADDLRLGLEVARRRGATAAADAVAARHDELAGVEELDRPVPPLGGDEVMTLLGVSGPDVGAAIDVLEAARLESGPLDEATARELLERWWAARSEPDRAAQ